MTTTHDFTPSKVEIDKKLSSRTVMYNFICCDQEIENTSKVFPRYNPRYKCRAYETKFASKHASAQEKSPNARLLKLLTKILPKIMMIGDGPYVVENSKKTPRNEFFHAKYPSKVETGHKSGEKVPQISLIFVQSKDFGLNATTGIENYQTSLRKFRFQWKNISDEVARSSEKSLMADDKKNIKYEMNNGLNSNLSKVSQLYSSGSYLQNFIFFQREGEIVPQQQTTKLLGVIINNKLTWDDQVVSMVSNASKRFWALKAMKKLGFQPNELVAFFKSSIIPVLEYASPVWGHALTTQQIADLENIQCRALKIIFGRRVKILSAEYIELLDKYGLQLLFIFIVEFIRVVPKMVLKLIVDCFIFRNASISMTTLVFGWARTRKSSKFGRSDSITEFMVAELC
ncbi:hypothetical protein Fcan01_21002 [Folsomia candida]|uniref:RNA-directed DNA polymerase from mobile element jockey n=1 Tax=Folsomia candida TaxID=158441 RepID=A0A226DG53_FOLCA|nr:hypothetical protein Fcan01_21002 [Folsomia candida]